jgi:hypothetical protein
VAVAVAGTPGLVIDRHYVVVEVTDAARTRLGRALGHNLWESLPGAETLFRPHCELAWRTGRSVEFVEFYEGRVVRVTATHRKDHLLALSWQVLARVDTLTLDGLRSSLSGAISALEASERRTSTLRLVE